jgi:octaprenyl-diphosphate synthase
MEGTGLMIAKRCSRMALAALVAAAAATAAHPEPATDAAPDYDAVRVLIAAEMRAVDARLTERLASDVALVNQLSSYILMSGGKRLRPVLALLSALAAGYRPVPGRPPAHVDIAVIVELIHTATLLHDDVVDESDMRRGRETANLVWGNQASVLVGDFLYSRAFQMMVALDEPRVLEILADATNTIAEGEVMQLVNCHDPEISESRYLDTIRFKTAKLFEAAAELGVVIAGRHPARERALAAYGRHLGTAFQLVDDVLDYSASSTTIGKNVGDDLAEGKPTLPLLYAMWHGSAEEAAVVREAIEQGGRDRIDVVLGAIESTGAIAYTSALARSEAQRAVAALADLPESRYAAALRSIAEFAVNRCA